MEDLARLFNIVDLFLICPYRWPEDPVVGWWVGTIFLALWSIIAGELTSFIAFRVNRFHVRDVVRETAQLHNQSMSALRVGNKKAYRAINWLANEAYGRTIFLEFAMAASSLWPIPFALAWLQTRFSKVQFPLPFYVPLVGDRVSYPFVFIPLYILIRILFGKAKEHFRPKGS